MFLKCVSWLSDLYLTLDKKNIFQKHRQDSNLIKYYLILHSLILCNSLILSRCFFQNSSVNEVLDQSLHSTEY